LKYLFFTLLLTCLLSFCAREQAVSLKKVPPPMASRSQQLQHLLAQWNQYHQIGHSDSLAMLYDTSLFFYGADDAPRDACVAMTRATLGKYQYYRQYVDSVEWDLFLKDSARVICYFLKKVRADADSLHFYSYLNFRWDTLAKRYFISNEGDFQTDAALERQRVAAGQIFETGDFNADSVPEKMWLRLEPDSRGLQSWCSIRFSNPRVPVLPVMNCIGGVPRNEGDLDGDGADEISLLPWWYQSRFTTLRVFTLKKGKWYTLIPGVYCSRDDLDAPAMYRSTVERGDDSTFVWIREHEWKEPEGVERYVRRSREWCTKALEIFHGLIECPT
jgi:hypothetical protein